eukprot:12447086-Heterocapsa_arctica.AAC.1
MMIAIDARAQGCTRLPRQQRMARTGDNREGERAEPTSDACLERDASPRLAILPVPETELLTLGGDPELPT